MRLVSSLQGEAVVDSLCIEQEAVNDARYGALVVGAFSGRGPRVEGWRHGVGRVGAASRRVGIGGRSMFHGGVVLHVDAWRGG